MLYNTQLVNRMCCKLLPANLSVPVLWDIVGKYLSKVTMCLKYVSVMIFSLFLHSTLCSWYLFHHCLLSHVLSLLLCSLHYYITCFIPCIALDSQAQLSPYFFLTCITYIYLFIVVYKLTRVNYSSLVYSLYSNIQPICLPLKSSGLDLGNSIV